MRKNSSSQKQQKPHQQPREAEGEQKRKDGRGGWGETLECPQGNVECGVSELRGGESGSVEMVQV